jgi:hypothetical protein
VPRSPAALVPDHNFAVSWNPYNKVAAPVGGQGKASSARIHRFAGIGNSNGS